MTVAEDVLNDALREEIACQFDLHNEGELLPYFWLREQIRLSAIGKRKRTREPLNYMTIGSFILTELQVFIDGKEQLYVGETAGASWAAYGTPFRLILEDWCFQANRSDRQGEARWDKTVTALLKRAEKAVTLKKGHPLYATQLEALALDDLNTLFHVVHSGNVGTHLVLNPEALFTPTREEQLDRLLTAHHQSLHISTHATEEEVETCLMQHLDLIEPGLSPIARQVVLPNGRIDILARSKEKQDVIIEVKVEKDTDIIWQRMYYEKEWEKAHATPRMVIVTTEALDDSIKDMLLELGETLVLEVTPYAQGNALVKLVVNSRYTVMGDRKKVASE